eukprot:scaffold108783_cov84-Phaeocystis_antarctica.AAC.5
MAGRGLDAAVLFACVGVEQHAAETRGRVAPSEPPHCPPFSVSMSATVKLLVSVCRACSGSVPSGALGTEYSMLPNCHST